MGVLGVNSYNFLRLLLLGVFVGSIDWLICPIGVFYHRKAFIFSNKTCTALNSN